MSMKLKNFFGILLGLALMIGLMPGISLMAYATVHYTDQNLSNIETDDILNATTTAIKLTNNMGAKAYCKIADTASEPNDGYTSVEQNGSFSLPVGKKYICIQRDAKSDSDWNIEYYSYTFAEVKYPLWVGGTQVTSANASNIDGSNKASYDADSKTLTLNGYSYSDNGECINYTGSDKLNIVLSGENAITITDGSIGIYAKDDLSLSGTGSLSVKTNNNSCISLNKNISIDGVTLSLESGFGGVSSSGGKVTINNSRVTSKGSDGIGAPSGVEIIGSNVECYGGDLGIYSTNSSGDIKIDNSTVTVETSNTGIYSRVSSNVIIINSTVEATGRSGIIGSNEVKIEGATTVNANGNGFVGIRGANEGISIDENIISLIASGKDYALLGTVKNHMAGTGWTNTEGTEGKANIDISSAGQSLENYKKVQFPEAKDPSQVTKEPEAKTLTYSGSAQELVTAGTAEGGTMQYALGKDATTVPTEGWSGNIPTATDAKTYYVWYKAKGDESHSDSDANYVTVKIEEKTEAHTHKIVHVEAKEPTCTEDGYEAHYECTECDKWFNDYGGHYQLDETEKAKITKKATGHKWDKGEVTKEPTYDEEGIRTYTCENDPSHTKEETIPMKTRSYDSDSSSDSESSGGGSSGKSGSISTKSIDVDGNTIQTQPDSGAPLSDRGGNWGNQEHIWTYTKSDGSLAKGEWLNLEYDGHTYWYYFDDSTIMQTNWFDYNGSRYFLVPEMDGWRGRMATGWHMVDNKWYYFEPTIGANQGILYRGMTTPDGHTVGADGAWDGNGTTPVGAIHTGTTVTMN